MQTGYIIGACCGCVLNMTVLIFISSLPLANLTGHTERVGIENFELLKVLGTGGKCLHVALYKYIYSCQN